MYSDITCICDIICISRYHCPKPFQDPSVPQSNQVPKTQTAQRNMRSKHAVAVAKFYCTYSRRFTYVSTPSILLCLDIISIVHSPFGFDPLSPCRIAPTATERAKQAGSPIGTAAAIIDAEQTPGSRKPAVSVSHGAVSFRDSTVEWSHASSAEGTPR